MSEHFKGQLVRALRLLAAVLASQPIASAFASSTLVRYPLAAALVAAFEVAVRQGFPVKPLPRISSVLAPAPSPLGLPRIGPGGTAKMRTAPPPLPPMTSPVAPAAPDGSAAATTSTSPAPPAVGGAGSP